MVEKVEGISRRSGRKGERVISKKNKNNYVELFSFTFRMSNFQSAKYSVF